MCIYRMGGTRDCTWMNMYVYKEGGGNDDISVANSIFCDILAKKGFRRARSAMKRARKIINFVRIDT